VIDPANDSIPDVLPAPFEWCVIPAGKVTLESNAGTFEVKPFKIAMCSVTYAQFQVFIDAQDGFQDDRWWQGLAERDKQPGEQCWKIADHPRETVTWYAAVAFCRWLSDRAGYEVRLPAEWEWQWAAQGPDGRQYPWGDEYIKGYANVKVNSAKGGVLQSKTTAVGSYPQGVSPFGVLDMAGNVWEWCLNEFNQPGNIGTSGFASRVVRGGSMADYEKHARCASRGRMRPSRFYNCLGFRVVLSLSNADF
jgi:formylglycine-generating enzyme required for sulfatase activity